MQRCLSVRCIPVFIRGRGVREPADIQFSAGATMLRAKTTTSNTCIMDCKISFMSFCDSLLSIQYNNILYWFIPWRSKSPSPSSQTRERAHSQQDLWKVKKKEDFTVVLKLLLPCEVHSQCLCTECFRFLHLSLIMVQEWLQNYLWCHKSCQQAQNMKRVF